MYYRNRLFTLLFIILLPLSSSATESGKGTITMEFDLSAHDATEESRLWIPYPLSDRDQLITDIQIRGDFTESAVYSDRKFSTPILYARWNKGQSSRKLHFSFHVERKEVKRRNFPKQEAAWDPADYSLYLAPTSCFLHNRNPQSCNQEFPTIAT